MSPVQVGVNKCIDARSQLSTIHHRSPDFRVLFRDGVEGTTERLERELPLLEWSHEGSESELLVDILLYIVLKQRGALKVAFGVAWGWTFREL